MRSRFIHTALLMILALPGVGAADEDAHDLEAKKAAVKLQAQIPLAVDRGVAWLAAKQRDDGSFGTTFDDGDPSGQPAGHAGHRLGRTALTLYTLVHCGRTAHDPAVARGLALIRKSYKQLLKPKAPPGEAATYSISIVLMLLYELYTQDPLVLDEEGKPEGDRAVPTARNPLGLPSWALRMVNDCTKWLVRSKAPDGLFGYPSPMQKVPKGMQVPKALLRWLRENGRSDNSNTQFAMLGLWAGTRLGARVPKRALEELADAILGSQSPGGPRVRRRFDPEAGGNPADDRYAGPEDEARGFPYNRARPRASRGGKQLEPSMPVYETGSMTAGGLSSLLIAKAMLTEAEALDAKLAQRLDKGIWDAFAWLAKHFRVDGNPGAVNASNLPPALAPAAQAGAPMGGTSFWPLYYLYSLERACVIAGKRYIGTHDWYLEGAAVVVGWQADDGAFRPKAAAGWMDLPNTCFALLFLKRASLRPRAALVRITPPPADDR